MSVASIISVGIGLVSGASFAQMSAEPHPLDKYFSRDSIERVDTGFDLTLQPGMRWFSANSLEGFVDSESTADDEFGSGMGFDLGLHFRFSSTLSLGLELGLGGNSSQPNYESLKFGTRTYKLLGRLSDPMSGFWLEASIGKGSFNAKSVESADDRLSMKATLFGAKAGFQFAPISKAPGLSFGPYLGLEAWQLGEMCATSGSGSPDCLDLEDASTPVGIQAGISLRFVLPVSLKPIPPPPPTEEFMLVRSRHDVATSEGLAPEVTGTPTYNAVLPKIRRVALSAPDMCASKTAANTTGQATQTDTVMQTACGVEMSEIERALTRQGYEVQSWKTLGAMVRDQHMTPRDAAAKLGAQVLFQVNSLENVTAPPNVDGRWDRTYYTSTAYGDQLAQVQPSAGDLASLQALVSQPEVQARQVIAKGAMLDVNAILVSSGQTMWFYRWTRLDGMSAGQEVRALARRLSNETLWQLTTARTNPSAPQQVNAPDTATYHSTGGPSSAKDARYFQLMREVVGDFVARFTQAKTEL